MKPQYDPETKDTARELELVKGTISDLVLTFFTYGRREDEELTPEVLERLLESGELNGEDIVRMFTEAVDGWFE